MTPLIVTATMASAVEYTMPIMLDGLLGAVVARSRGLIAPRSSAEVEALEIPIRSEPGGRFHLCSEAHHGARLFARLVHIHKRATVREYAYLCTGRVKRVNIKSGPDKGWRVPRSGEFYSDLYWWCIGDPVQVQRLLMGVVHLGARRRHGCGRVREWRVEPIATWDGFPVLRDGRPLRPLPIDYPGLAGGRQQFRNLTMPYYLDETQEMLACP